MARLRSPSYPSVSLPDAIEMIEKIHSVERTYPVERSVAAQHLGYTGITGHSAKILAALLQYGLLEKVAKNEVRVSDIAVEILHPDDREQKAEALHRAAFKPALFGDLLDRFPDGVPSEGNLRSYLVKQGFSDRAIGPAIKAYLQTCEYAQQMTGYESHGSDVPRSVESSYDQYVEDRSPMRATEIQPSMPSSARPRQPESVILNQINADISGGLVRIDVLLDKKGLVKLKQKLQAIQTLISDDEEDIVEDEQDEEDSEGETD